jgi:hypothetical protein
MDKSGIERLRQRAIDSSLEEARLQAVQELRQKQQEERQAQRQQRQDEKTKKRIEQIRERTGSFIELASLNRSLTSRAKEIVDLYQLFQERPNNQSPWILLEKGDETHGGWVAGFIETRSLDDDDRSFATDFKIYVTDANSVRHFRKHPLNTIVNSPGPEVESLYPTSRASEDRDFIIQQAVKYSGERFFNPAHALKRSTLLDKFSEHLTSMQNTISLFEAAIIDPSLNPHIVRARQQLPESA